jgi:hypothetical protein
MQFVEFESVLIFVGANAWEARARAPPAPGGRGASRER